MTDNTHRLMLAGCVRDLPIVAVNETTRIAFLDVLGDMELLDSAVKELLARTPPDVDLLFGGDTVGLVVVHHASIVSGIPYVVARKKHTVAMRNPLQAAAQSVAASTPTTFYLDDQHADRMAGRHVLIMDEVCSTGATLRALTDLAERAGAAEVTRAVICTEGQIRDDVVAIGHLPVWVNRP